ncbi:MAG: S8 family serine peptidase [Caldilineales bacterium]
MNSARMFAFAAAVVAMIALTGMAAAPAVSEAAAPVHPEVTAALQQAEDGRAAFYVLLAEQADLTPAYEMDDWTARGQWVVDALQTTAGASQAPLLRALQSASARGHVANVRPFWIVNTVAVYGDQQAVDLVARLPGVAQILPEVKLELPDVLVESPTASPQTVEWNVARINADDVWALGYTGAGMVVANLDTGVDYTHPALVGKYRGNQGGGPGGPFEHNYNWFDPYWNTTSPHALPWQAGGTVPSGHGTHVMGTMVGSSGVNEIGVAPDAQWIATFGCCPDNATLLAALQWHLAPTRLDGTSPNPALRAQVLQNSWGGAGGSSIYAQAMAALKASGMFVSASAGNGGPACGTLGSPGDLSSVFSVGGTDRYERIYSSSARGPNPFSRATGPALVAPGVGVRSSVPGGYYQEYTGTSMAGPHAAGAVALLWQANPALIGQVDYTADLLRKTATPFYVDGESCGGVDSGSARPNNSAGWGELDILRAVQLAGTGQSKVIVQARDGSAQPLAGVSLSLRRSLPGFGDVQLEGTTDSSGRFEFLVSPGQAAVGASLYGHASPAPVNVTVGNGSTTVNVTLPVLPIRTVTGQVVERLSNWLFLPAVAAGGQPARLADTVTSPSMPSAAKRLDARVSVVGESVTPVQTDCTGTFSLNLPAGRHTLLVEATGYRSQQIIVDTGNTEPRTVYLAPVWDYTVADSRSGGVPFAWIDATSGTRYALGDESYLTIALAGGASFTYYGQPYSQFSISSNGFISFGQPFTGLQGVIPFEGAPNNAIYALAEDLNPAAGSPGNDNGIYVRTVGGKTVVQYNQVEHWSSGNPETFQVILDTTNDQVTLQYNQVSWPDFTTVGVENSAGDRGISWSYANSGNIQPGLAVRFIPVYGQAGVSCQ